jgi:hydroxymethylbilane synthase
MGGCATPISALAVERDDKIHFRGNLLSLDGKEKIEIEKNIPVSDAASLGEDAAHELLANGGQELIATIRHV